MAFSSHMWPQFNNPKNKLIKITTKKGTKLSTKKGQIYDDIHITNNNVVYMEDTKLYLTSFFKTKRYN